MTNENPNEVLVPIETCEDVQVGDELVCQRADPLTGLRAGERATVKTARTDRLGCDRVGAHILLSLRESAGRTVTIGPSWHADGYHISDWQKVVKPPAGETWSKIESYSDLKVGMELVCVVPKPTTPVFKFLYRLVKKTPKPVPVIVSAKETTMVRDVLGAIPRGTQVWRKSDGKAGTIYSVKGTYYSSGLFPASLSGTRYEVSLGAPACFSESMTEEALLRDYSFTKPEAHKDCICTYLVNGDGTPHQTRETPTTEERAKRIAKDLGAPWKAYRLVPLDD